MDKCYATSDDNIPSITYISTEYYDSFWTTDSSSPDITIDREISSLYHDCLEVPSEDITIDEISLDIEYAVDYFASSEPSISHASGEKIDVLDHSIAGLCDECCLLCYSVPIVMVEYTHIRSESIPEDTDSLHTVTSDEEWTIREVTIR